MRGETKQLDELARRSAEGSFIQLSDGITHYQLSNPNSSHTVVLIHGFSVPYFIYDPTFAFLTQAGYRVIRYDLFGRGFSDRPRLRYNLDFFVKQLGDLIDGLGLAPTGRSAGPPPMSLIGLSMGGAIATAFTARNPGRVHKLILIDPVGARPISLPGLFMITRIPFLAEAVVGVIGTDFLLNSIAGDFFDPAWVAHFLNRYKVQMQYNGFGRAILSTIRNGMLASCIDMYRELGSMPVPVLLFWGRNDDTVPFDHSDDLRAAVPQAEFHVVEQCGHIPQYEKPDEVNPILLAFLRKT